MFDLKTAIQQKTDMNVIAEQLNACSHEQRYALTQSLNGKDQKALWDLCVGRAFLLSDLVPNHVPHTTPVRHLGKTHSHSLADLKRDLSKPKQMKMSCGAIMKVVLVLWLVLVSLLSELHLIVKLVPV
jgi:hypothetical protein